MNEQETLKNRFGDQAFKNKSREPAVALAAAYADMSRRCSGHKPAMKDACMKYLLSDAFTGQLWDTDFDTWHEKQCGALIKIWNGIKQGFGTVGKAQKVLNMAFKYLSCINGNYDPVLPYCHMTLDSYTLAWYKDVVRPWAEKNGRADVESLTEWSSMKNYSDYKLIQDNIRKFLEQGASYSVEINGKATHSVALSAVPMEAEFVIWEGQIVKERYTNLIKALRNYTEPHRGIPAGKENDAWLIGDLFTDYLRDYVQKL